MATAAERITQVLTLLEQHAQGLSASELAQSLSISRVAASRLFSLMLDAGLVEREAGGKYVPSLGLWMTSSAAIQRLPLLDFSYVPMADAARRSGLELALGINRGTETFFLLRAERVHDVVVAKLVGRKRPIHVSATGKAILAFEPPEVIEAVLRSGVVERTNSGLGLDELREDLEFTRQTGHARNFGEGRPPGRGIAVPIFDGQHRVVAGLGAPLPLSGGSEEQVVAVLQEARYEIARSLGYVKELELSLP